MLNGLMLNEEESGAQWLIYEEIRALLIYLISWRGKGRHN